MTTETILMATTAFFVGLAVVCFCLGVLGIQIARREREREELRRRLRGTGRR